MPSRNALISRMRTLVNTQKPDSAWLSAVNELSPVPLTRLNIFYWNRVFNPKEYGTLERTTIEEKPTIVWNRPDGGMPIALEEGDEPMITFGRFIMYFEIMKHLQAIGQLSFVKVGYPANWRNVIVHFNGKIYDGSISADALLNTIEVLTKDNKGRFQYDENQVPKTELLHGAVSIEVRKESQSFF